MGNRKTTRPNIELENEIGLIIPFNVNISMNLSERNFSS
jgi:hypothetical protein